LNSLKKIDFFSNQITKIHPSTFKGLTNLEEINFRWNKIKELDPTTFNGLTSLKVIKFKNDENTTIRSNTIRWICSII